MIKTPEQNRIEMAEESTKALQRLNGFLEVLEDRAKFLTDCLNLGDGVKADDLTGLAQGIRMAWIEVQTTEQELDTLLHGLREQSSARDRVIQDNGISDSRVDGHRHDAGGAGYE